MSRRLSFLVCVLISLTAVTAKAQTTFTWTGLAGDQLFETPGNWQGGVVPTGNPTDNIVFGVYPQQTLTISTSLNVGDITFSGIQDGFYLESDGSPTLTLNGNVTVTAGSNYWGLFALPVILSAGNHIYSPGGTADIYHFDTISGPGGIIKNGPNNLILTQTNTYTGGTTINSGIIFVGLNNGLGTGPVTINDGGTLATSYTDADAGEVVLPNNFILGANPVFGSYVPDNQSLVLGNNGAGTTIAPATGVTTVNLTLHGDQALFIDGGMIDGTAPTKYTFTGDSGFFLSGNNTYTGGTLVKSGSSIEFYQPNSLPATGLISAEAGAYVGLGTSGVSVATFISRLDPANFAGIVGFDDDYNTYAGNIDLTNFAHPEVAIGSASDDYARLTGAITPPAGASEYRFGSGTIFLDDSGGSAPLSGNYDLHVFSSLTQPSALLVYNRAAPNTYTGVTIAEAAGIIFDSPGSLPATTSLELLSGGYIGVTDTSGLTLADLVAKVGTIADGGALGVDVHDWVQLINGAVVTVSSPVDFSSLSQPVYFGTSSNILFNGSITTTNDNADDYYLTAFQYGTLAVQTQLTGNRQVHVGLPDVYQDAKNYNWAQVELDNVANNFTGGVVLNSGLLTVVNPLALGPGALTAEATSSDGIVGLDSTGTITNNIVLQSGTLQVQTGSNLELAGTISGSGSLSSIGDLTISGNNTYDGGSFFGTHNVITATSNTALGTGLLSLDQGARVVFSSTPAPAIGSLVLGEPYINTDDGYIEDDAAIVLAGTGGSSTLTINQTVDGIFSGSILEEGTTGSLVKTGPAALTIVGTNYYEESVYSGGTTILQGKLIAGSAGALGAGPITLNGGTLGVSSGVVLTNAINFGVNGGTLAGNGTFAVPITIGTGAILAPGNSPGLMTFASGLTLASGGQLDFEVQAANGPAGTGYDLLSISGGVLDITATSGAPFTLRLISLNAGGTAGDVSDFSAGTGYSWLVATSVGGINGFAANKFTLDSSSFSNVLGGGVFSLTQGVSGGNSALFLNFSPVPEPSTYALMLTGLTAVLLSRRRRNRIAS